MAQLIINIPNEYVSRVLDAFASTYGYEDMIPNPLWTPDNSEEELIPNPMTRAEFARRCVIGFIKDVVISRESALAAETARLDAVDDASVIVYS